MSNVFAVPVTQEEYNAPTVETVVHEVIESELRNGEPITLHTSGICMLPVLQDSQLLIFRKSPLYLPGDMVAFHCPYQKLRFVHRFLGYVWAGGEWKCLIMADNAARPDTLVRKPNVLGKVISQDKAKCPVGSVKRCRSLFRYCYWVFRLLLERLFTRST
jgi:hypothetical protein